MRPGPLSLEVYWARRLLFGAGPAARTARRRTLGAVLAVGLSLVPLMVVFQVAGGMIEGITLRYLEVGTYHLQAISRGDLEPLEVADAAGRLEGLDGVVRVVQERRGVGLLYSDAGRTGTAVRAVGPGFPEDPGVARYLIERAGEFRLSSEEDIVLGSEIARRLEVAPGDEVRLLTVLQRADRPPIPRIQVFRVAGVITTGYQDLDRLWSFIPLDLGRRILPDTSAQEILGIKITDPFSLDNPFRRGDEALGGLPDEAAEELGRSWRVFSWFELERSQYLSFVTTKNLLVLIMALIVAVAAVTISSALVMLVLEKQQEIAFLKALGASPGHLRRTFLIAGFVLGCLGAAVGVVVGLLAAVHINEILRFVEIAGNGVLQLLFGGELDNLNRIDIFNPEFYLQDIPIRLRLEEVFPAAAGAILLATVSSFFPAGRAARIRPLEILSKH